jgi:hypothetical protein
VLERVSAPLKKADLLTVVHYVIGQLPYNQVPTLAKRHKVEEGKSTKTPQELLAKRVSTYDETALCRLLLEISLLDSAYMRSGASDDLLTDAAKRYRVDIEKLEKAVVAELRRNAVRAPNLRPRQKQSPSVNPVANDSGGVGPSTPPFFFVLYCLHVRSLGYLQNGTV